MRLLYAHAAGACRQRQPALHLLHASRLTNADTDATDQYLHDFVLNERWRHDVLVRRVAPLPGGTLAQHRGPLRALRLCPALPGLPDKLLALCSPGAARCARGIMSAAERVGQLLGNELAGRVIECFDFCVIQNRVAACVSVRWRTLAVQRRELLHNAFWDEPGPRAVEEAHMRMELFNDSREISLHQNAAAGYPRPRANENHIPPSFLFGCDRHHTSR